MATLKWTGPRSSARPTPPARRSPAPERRRGGHAVGQSERTHRAGDLGVPRSVVWRGGPHAPRPGLRRHQGRLFEAIKAAAVPGGEVAYSVGVRALQALEQDGAFAPPSPPLRAASRARDHTAPTPPRRVGEAPPPRSRALHPRPPAGEAPRDLRWQQHAATIEQNT